MRWSAVIGGVVCFALLSGCATERTITITTNPADAIIRVDGQERGRGPVQQPFAFDSDERGHTIQAYRVGYDPIEKVIYKYYQGNTLQLTLRPSAHRISITVNPPAYLSLDGKRVSQDLTASYSPTLEFPPDPKNPAVPLAHTVTAERPNYQVTTEQILYTGNPNITLDLKPLTKDLLIKTSPPGARVLLDGQPVGATSAYGLRIPGVTFPIDPDPFNPEADRWGSRVLTIEKPGYESLTQRISWNDENAKGSDRSTYEFPLTPLTKTIHITATTRPFVATIDGQPYHSGPDGAVTINKLEFSPLPGTDQPRTYNVVVSPTGDARDWKPETLAIGYDDGRRDYSANLREVMTRSVPLVVPEPRFASRGWEIVPRHLTTVATKHTSEGIGKEPPVRITTPANLPPGSQIDTLTVSPDGTRVLFTAFTATDPTDFRSQILMTSAEGGGPMDRMTDGQALELTPAFTPDGRQIVFASNRPTGRLKICQMPASGKAGVILLSPGNTTDLWPSVDNDPNPRVYFEGLLDSPRQPRLFVINQSGAAKARELNPRPGTQPRVSPRADRVVFTAVNPDTGKQEIWRMSDRGADPQPLVNTPGCNNRDPVWSPDGSKIAFASDRTTVATDDGKDVPNFDIYVIDLAHPERARQITTNGSWDDCPAWDATGNYLYFRSNRGGEWAIWKISVR